MAAVKGPGVCWQELEGEVKAPEVTTFRYVAFGLSGCRAEDYLARPEPLAWALAALMDPGTWSRVDLRHACLQRIGGARLPVERRGLLEDFVDAYLPLTSQEQTGYKMREESTRRGESKMWMTWSERTRAEGFRKGKREGRKEATRETLRKILLRQLRRRFGPLPEVVKQQIEGITSVSRLNGLLERVLTASSLKELGLHTS